MLIRMWKTWAEKVAAGSELECAPCLVGVGPFLFSLPGKRATGQLKPRNSPRCSLRWISRRFPAPSCPQPSLTCSNMGDPVKNGQGWKKKKEKKSHGAGAAETKPPASFSTYLDLMNLKPRVFWEGRRALQSSQYAYVPRCSRDYWARAHSKQSQSHLRVCLKFCDVSCSHLASARLVRHREPEKGAVVISSGLRYLPQPSSISAQHLLCLQMRSGRWGSGGRRKGTAPSGNRRRRGPGREDGKQEGCTQQISARASNQSRGPPYRALISCCAAPTPCNGCWLRTGTRQRRVKGIRHLKTGGMFAFWCWAFSVFIKNGRPGPSGEDHRKSSL